MPIYHQSGKIPRKRHTTFRKNNGELYYEHLMGNKGFAGLSSLMYHLRRPTSIIKSRIVQELKWQSDKDRTLRMRHFQVHNLSTEECSVSGRIPLLFNNDVALSFVAPRKSDKNFYRNAQGDEVIFVSEGEGVLHCPFGEIAFSAGDYLVIPRAITHNYSITKPCKFLIIESKGDIRTPKRYRNEHGQLLEHSPFCERDIRKPENLNAIDEKGEFPILVKRDNLLHEMVLDHHPYDVIGWDGYYYPWAFNIHDFEPITGRIHQPPPVHQTFEGDGFVICSFVPRLFDYHPEAVPAPYQHSNVMTDEVLYYANDEFMSRKGIKFGSITLHPDGAPHGPQPGKLEESIGKTETKELAVMIDTFQPLQVSAQALECEDPNYGQSWL